MGPFRALLVAYRLVLCFLGVTAITTEIATLVERGNFNPANFFSFFTIESNILVAATLLLGALAAAAGTRAGWLDTLRGAVTVYILVVGIGFSLLLANLEGIALTAVPWDNTVLHYIVPVGAFVDYALDRPQKRLAFRPHLAWLLYPIAYAAYSLIRGAITGWYPYPFLDPDEDGYAAVAATIAGLLVLGVALTWVVCRLSGRGRAA